MQDSLFRSLTFSSGKIMKNRFLLAPMTNTQSHEDGCLSNEELNWLTMRAKGGFGMTMTCAAHVQAVGKGFPGQLGVFDDKHIDGHRRLSKAIQDQNSLAVIQLHHAGIRSPKELIGQQPQGPSVHSKTASRGLSKSEVVQLRDDFVTAAVRAEKAGYDGVEIHGAHGYILAQFLSNQYNQRNDEYGGTFENRSRIIKEIIEEIRSKCGNEFILGLRLSPERYGIQLPEIKAFCQELDEQNTVDFLDISLWDVFKYPEDAAYGQYSLLEHFGQLDWKHTAWTVAGKINGGETAAKVIKAGVDFVGIGQAAILHHDFPLRIQGQADFVAHQLPVTPDYLKNEGLSDKFITYMRRWPNFVTPE